jgi:hypothetical protein
MPTIKGGITLGKRSSKEDLEKFAKATGRQLLSINGVPVKQEKKVAPKKKVVK